VFQVAGAIAAAAVLKIVTDASLCRLHTQKVWSLSMPNTFLDAREDALYPAGLSFSLYGLKQHINRARGRARKAAGSNPSSLPNIELKLRGDEVDLGEIELEPTGIFISEVEL
jgi:hypothetical protein